MSDYNTQPPPSTGTTTTEEQITTASTGSLPKTGDDFDGVFIGGLICIMLGFALIWAFMIRPWLKERR
jgi:LPXTG-motif cell wall-anchored protein